MNTKEAAIFWGISQSHVCRLCKTGRVKTAKKIKGRWYIHPLASKPFDKRFKLPRIITLSRVLGVVNTNRCQIDCPKYRILDNGLIEIINIAEHICYMKKWGLEQDYNIKTYAA